MAESSGDKSRSLPAAARSKSSLRHGFAELAAVERLSRSAREQAEAQMLDQWRWTMRKRLTLLLAVGILGVGVAAPGASADAYRVAQDETTAEDEDDGGTDYGWIGLLGLAGLAGLAGRKRRDDVVHTEPVRSQSNVTRDR